MKKINRFEGVLALGLGLAIVSCGAAKPFSENREYVHSVFKTRTACRVSQREMPDLNCFPSLKLTKDGKAELIVTDVVNHGTYYVFEKTLTIEFEPYSEVGDTLTFTLSDDGKSATNDKGQTFERQEH